MKKGARSYANDPIVYLDGKERRSLDLRPYGVACIPFLGLSNFQTVRTGTEEHVHEGCVEVSLCLRGNLAFEADGIEYPFLPGSVFVSQPHEPHRMRHNPKGLMLQRILFKIPKKGACVLDLPRRENAWLVREMQNFPMRLFPATERVKVAFARLFERYDSEERGTVSCRLKMKAAVLELLLALIEAPHAPASSKGRPHAKVKAIVERLRKMPTENYPVENLAQEAALSVVAFTDAFKRATGLPLTPSSSISGSRPPGSTSPIRSRILRRSPRNTASRRLSILPRSSNASPAKRLARTANALRAESTCRN